MLKFLKKFKINAIARDERDDEENEISEAHFAPEITVEKRGKVRPFFGPDDESETFEETRGEDGLRAAYDAVGLPEDRTFDDVSSENGEEKKDAFDIEELLKKDAGGEEERFDIRTLLAQDRDGETEAESAVFDAAPEGPYARTDAPDPEDPGKSEAGEDAEDAEDAEAAEDAEDAEDAGETTESPEEAEAREAEAEVRAALFTELSALPANRRVYGVYGKEMLLSCPDGKGGVLLFDRTGGCIAATPGDCSAFIRICGAEGWFRGKHEKTGDVVYLLDEQTFPLSFVAKNRAQYDLALEDGYLPDEKAEHVNGILMIKPLSLYRVKDLMLRVEYADGGNVAESDEYLLDADRSFFDGPTGMAQFARVGRACAETLSAEKQPFFTVQVQKVRRNLTVVFPMDGRPAIGDLLAGERITDLAQMEDGALLLKLGYDDKITPALKEGESARGQHKITLSK